MEEEAKKETLTEWLDKHPKTVFWTRLSLWAIFACILPFVFISWRFELFNTVSKIKIGGWGIIAIVIVAVFIFSLIRYLKLYFGTKYTLTGQCLSGFCKVILPLCVTMVTFYAVKSDIELMLQVLGVVTASEFIAIPLNPLPKWVYEKQKNVRADERKETVDYLLDGFFTRKEKEDKK